MIDNSSFEIKYINNPKPIPTAIKIESNFSYSLSDIYLTAEDGLRMEIDGVKVTPKTIS